MKRDLRLGFRIERCLELQQWKVIELAPEIPLATLPLCPADGTSLRTFCTFTDASGGMRLRVGCCSSCGHISYIDRPTKTWIDRYYLDSWDTGNDVATRVDKRTRKLEEPAAREKTVVACARALDVDRRRPVCEIGCGWGVSLKHLMLAGFSNVVGTEASAHRASAVRAGLHVSVLTAPFESEAAQRELAALAPFSVILSNHVLEHTYQPDDVIAAASRLQHDGDYLIVAVPNQEGEPPMGVLMFLPHLHSFTRRSLARLAARHGYAMVDDTHVRARQLVMVFRKSAIARPVEPIADDTFERTVAAYIRLLALDRWHAGLRRLWWLKRGGPAQQRWMLGSGRLEARRWQRAIERHGYRDPRSLAIRTLRTRFTSAAESPLEIQCPGPVSLFYK